MTGLSARVSDFALTTDQATRKLLSSLLKTSSRQRGCAQYAGALALLLLLVGAGLGSLHAQTAQLMNWAAQSPATAPPARYGAAMAYDSGTNTVVLFGGYGSSGAMNDTWAWNGTSWTHLAPAAAPSARYYSTMAYDASTNTVVLFGGLSSSDVALSDTWTWNGTTWTQRSPVTSPPARQSASMTYDTSTHTVVLFGGSATSGIQNDTWTWNGTNWTEQSPANAPTARHNAAMAYDLSNNTVVLFGGYGSSGALNDTWTWNGTNWIEQSLAEAPAAREDAAMAFDSVTSTVVLFGGYGGSSVVGDTWTWNGTTWTEQSAAGPLPARSLSAMAYDSSTNTVVLFGGSGNGGAYLNDTWTYQPALVGVNLGTVNVCPSGANIPPPCSQSSTLYFYFTAAGSGISSSVVTQGAADLDFTDAGTGTCDTNGTTHAYAVGDLCTVNVIFTPNAPGLRMGAVKLLGSKGATVATAYVYGTGQGPAVGFLPATQTALGVGLIHPWGVAVDAAGNVYSSSYNGVTTQIYKIAPDDTETAVGAPGETLGLAVDGAGNVIYAEYSGAVVIIPPGCVTTACQTAVPAVGLNGSDNIAVDGAGDVFITNYGVNRVLEVTPAGVQTTVPAVGLNGPIAVAVDSTGDVFISDSGNNRVVEVTPAGVQTTVPASGLSSPGGIAVDAAGDVFIDDVGNLRLLEVTPAGVQTTLPVTGGLNNPVGVAVDGAGNVYIANRYDDEIVKFGLSSASLSFATTAVGGTSTDSPQSVTVQNIGNQPLNAVSQGLTFPVGNFLHVNGPGAPADCTNTFALTPTETCNISISFEPNIAGSDTGILSLSDNALNGNPAVQVVSLQGTATQGSQTITFTTNAPASAAYNSMFTVAASSSSGLAVSYTSSGVCTNVSATYTMSAGSGTCTVTVNQAGNANYSAAPQVTESVSATKATQSITFTGFPAMATYGAAGPYPLNGTASSGLAVTYGVTGPASFAGSSLSITGAGTVSVTASQTGNANYSAATPVTQTIQVNPGSQTITFTGLPSTATYGASGPYPLNGTASSGLAVTYGVTGPASFAGSSLIITGAGTIAVTASQTGNANYSAATPITQTIQVNPATPIVTWPTAGAITYGQPLGSSTFSGGSASVPGNFVWTTPAAILIAGSQSASVTFIPSDSADYSSLTSTVSLTVNPANYVVTVSSDDAGTASNCTPQATPGIGTDASCSLRDALLRAAATGGGNISFASGAVGSLSLNSPLPTLTGQVNIAGPGANQLIFIGSPAGRFFQIGSGATVTLSGLTITGGTDGGSGGGAILNNGGILTVSNCAFSNNTSNSTNGGGAILNNGGTLSVFGSTFLLNAAPNGNGGAINSVGGQLTISYSTFDGDSAMGGNGGAIAGSGSSASIVANSTFYKNNASGNGGAIDGNITQLTVSSSIFANNSASQGAGLQADSGSLSAGNNLYYLNQDLGSHQEDDCGSCTTNTNPISGNPNFSTLNVSVGGTPTLLLQPPSAAICAGPAVAAGVDQRGLPNFTTYNGIACYDLGAVQSNYAQSITAQPPSTGTVSGVAMSPAPAVTVTESGTPTFAPVSITATDAASDLATTPATATAAAGIASFSNLVFAGAATADTLTTTLILNPANPAINLTIQSTSFSVGAATPTVTWPTASAITYGQTLASSTLSGGSAVSGSTSVSGSFAFTTPTSTPAAGAQSESVTFLPADSTAYNSVTTSISVQVNQATPSVTWPTASAITYGQTLTSSTLSGGSAVSANTAVLGTFAFTTPSTAPTAGTQSESVTFTPTDSTDYASATSTVSVLVNKATLNVTWPTASAITYGQTLASSTLSGGSAVSANTSIPGTFAFTTTSTAPTAGTQSESVTFTPTDSTDYASATSTVSVLVNKATLNVTWPTASAITYGQPLSSSTLSGGSASVAGTFTFTNPATVPTSGTQSVSVTFTPADTADYNSVTSSSAVSLQVYVATTTITLSNLVQTYTGNPISVTAIVSPSYCGPASVTYNNSSAVPMAIGTYTVLASIGNPNCVGPSVTGRLIINAFAAADCLYTLDPSAAKSFSVSGNSAITAQCNLQINSSNQDAFDVSGNASVTATAISVVGGASINGHPTVSVTPLTGQAALADPLAAVQAPTVGACTYTNWHNAGTTLNPGTYCGGITVSGKTTVNFNPGTYVLLGGGLNISGGAEATGSGVTFYNTGNSTYAYKPVSITGGSITSLAAPRSGPMAGVLFFQDRAIVSNAQNTVSGGSGTMFEGALYFPTTPLAYSGSSSATHAAYNLIVADTFTLSGGGSGYLTTLGN